MYLVIVLLLFPQVRAFVSNSYNGFDSCGENGWTCENYFPKSEITFDCSLSRSRNARLWIWTARLPSGIKKMTATNCHHLELHVDCTSSFRDAKIEQFRVINVRELTILKPTNTYEFLHDNSPIPHLPPYFHLENIGRVNFYKGLFRGAAKSCSYNSGLMKKMVMKNVRVDGVEGGAFESQLDEIVWSNVTFEKIEPGAFKINGTNLTIDHSHIGEIQNKAFAFNGRNVNLRWNRFNVIGPDSLNAYSYNFVFSHNRIGDLNSRGLVVQSSHVTFDNNTISELAKDALGAISPAYYITDDGPKAFTITYQFTGNEIIFMNRFSLHPDWKSYNGYACSKVTVDGNKFNCDCENLIWLRQYVQGGNAENAGFYQILLNTTHHCGTSMNCSLSAIIPYVCRNDSNIAAQCAGLKEKETFDNYTTEANWTQEDGLVGDPGTEVADTLEWDGSYSQRDDSEMVVGKSFYTYKSNGDGSDFGTYVWVAIFAGVTVTSLCCISVLAWYVKKRKRHNVVEIYKYDKTNDSDKLISHTRLEAPNESENPSFHD